MIGKNEALLGRNDPIKQGEINSLQEDNHEQMLDNFFQDRNEPSKCNIIMIRSQIKVQAQQQDKAQMKSKGIQTK